MTFSAFETSPRGGHPTHLFVFTRQGLVWRFAACDRDVTIGGNTYTAAPISRSAIKQTVEKPQDQVTITLPYMLDPNATELPVTQDLGNQWNPFVPTDPVSVLCLATHLNDPDQEIATQWIGVVGQPKYTDGQLELTCLPPGQISRARYQGAKWQKSCWKTLYSTGPRGCGLVPGPIPVAGTVTAVAGSAITAAEYVPQQRTFVGGTASWSDATTTPATPRTANITAASGTTLTLDNVAGIVVGTVVTASTIALQFPATITAISGTTLTAAEFATSTLTLAGGFIEFTRPDGLLERRSVMAWSGNTVTLLYPIPSLAVGAVVNVLPGCEHTWAACLARNNTVNYGGAVYMPVQSPYNGNSMSWG